MGIFLKEKIKYGQILTVSIDKIDVNPNQPRKFFDKEELECLAQSIKENGLLQPLTVRIKTDERYELIAGERRLRACKYAGLDEVRVIIENRNDEESSVLAIIENIQRCDLNCIEEAIALKKLMKHYGYTQEELARKLGKAQSTIANKLRILNLSENVLKLTIQYNLCERQIRALLRLPEEKREGAVEHINKYKLNVSSTEKYIDRLISAENKPEKFRWTFKEKRLYINNINRTLDTMKRSGIEFSSEKREENGYLEYIIRIPHD
ncbi:MAG: ParB/RepB/Spo0J family partition protein [Ruminiclostridium sp.]|nr:ParB/RepB/Spo0J family partition protein [Ruminiclostridium sp.]